jgi:hypothetical protein
MGQSSFWEADTRTASKDIIPHFVKPQVSLSFSKEPATGSYPDFNAETCGKAATWMTENLYSVHFPNPY